MPEGHPFLCPDIPVKLPCLTVNNYLLRLMVYFSFKLTLRSWNLRYRRNPLLKVGYT